MKSNEARERVLVVAEELFHMRGYNAVSMRDVASALDMRQASLYYHVPDGKEQLFVEITERGLQRHFEGISNVISSAEPALVAQLRAAARWLGENAPIRLISMLETDMPAISTENSKKLTFMAFQSFFSPITKAFEDAIERGEIRPHDANQLASHFLSMMDGISYSTTAGHTKTPIEQLAEEMIDILLNGLRAQ